MPTNQTGNQNTPNSTSEQPVSNNGCWPNVWGDLKTVGKKTFRYAGSMALPDGKVPGIVQSALENAGILMATTALGLHPLVAAALCTATMLKIFPELLRTQSGSKSNVSALSEVGGVAFGFTGLLIPLNPSIKLGVGLTSAALGLFSTASDVKKLYNGETSIIQEGAQQPLLAPKSP